MNIPKFCIEHKVMTILAFIIISIFGFAFTSRLQVSLLPNLELPSSVIVCNYYGTTPADIEELVTRPLEGAIMSVTGVNQVFSRSFEGYSMVQVYYEDGTDLDAASTRLREQFALLSLPDDVSEPVIMNFSISGLLPTALVALQGDDLNRLQSLAKDIVVPALERINGIASVSIYGGTERQITVSINSSRAEGYGINSNYVAQFLTSENILSPGGDINNGSRTLTVSTDAQFSSIEDIANTLITLPSGGVIRLSEVADIYIEELAKDTAAKMSDRECVILLVTKQSGANEASAAEAVEKRLESLTAGNSEIDYYIAYSAAEYINTAIMSSLQNIVLGVILAALVVFLFLRNLGTTLAIIVSMPVCILAVFVLMDVFDLTLNIMSIGGIAMGVGMIVDNSIVVLENIYSYAFRGNDRLSSCLDGTKEVFNSVMASTLTTAAVFLPLGLTGGMAGMLFRDFCLTIAFLVLSSLVIALTLVPLLCFLMLGQTNIARIKWRKAMAAKEHSAFNGFKELKKRTVACYSKVLLFFTRHILLGNLVCMLLIAVFVLTCSRTNMVLMPEVDQNSINVSISMPVGSSTKELTDIAEQVLQVVRKEVPELENCYYMTYGNGSIVAAASAGDVTVGVNLIDKGNRTRTASEIARNLRNSLQDIAGCEISVSSSDLTSYLSGVSSSEINVEIYGEDYNTMIEIADDLVKKISYLQDTEDISSSVSERIPQVKITVNRQMASKYGISAIQIATTVRTELSGITATTVTIENESINVVIKGNSNATASLDALRSLPIPTAFGGTVPLSYVANVETVMSPQYISRYNQSKQITITGGTISGNTTAITQELNQIFDSYPLPEGYSIGNAGTFEDMMEYFGDLLVALLVAIGLVYFVLASQFESFLMPVIVMMILPVAFSGALVSLPITGKEISMISIVSLIMLAGTVVNSSIILIDYINIRRKNGETREEAILHACPMRVRPVLMTTLTTILAIIPMASGIGNTNEMMSDMGVTMMGGMIISTIVTLVFTPVFYCSIDNIPSHFTKLRHKPSNNLE